MDGIININKPKGYTSHDIVAIIRKTINSRKCGHIGTLDPNAEGVLPILIGKATKISKYLIEHNKTYIAKIKLGKKTDTADALGEIIESKGVKQIIKDDVDNVLKSFLGKSYQIPPIYSAIKINGKKLYEYARKNEKVEVKARKIEILDISLISINNEKKEITFKVKCTRGTYIRTLCEDIAKKLETVGYMDNLIRTGIDNFNIEEAINIEDLSIENINSKIIKVEDLFLNHPKINLDNKKLHLVLNGVSINQEQEDGLYRIYSSNEFIGLGIVKNKLLKRDVIIKEDTKDGSF